MATLLALLSSILWGAADFFGGKLSKRYQALAVTAVSQAFGLITGILIIIVGSSWLNPAIGWDNYFISGVLAGLFGFVGLIAFYSGLATGRMGVVSPIAALSVLIPLTIAFITGEKPNSTQIVGMSIALLGAVCASGPTFGGFTKKDIPLLIGIGAADFIANLLLGVATTKGLVSLAVVLGSLFPIVTALLAFKLLHERLHKVQYLGITFAIIGVAVISLG